MKKIFALILSLSMIFTLSACGSQNGRNDTANTQPGSESADDVTETPAEALAGADTKEPLENMESTGKKLLVVYYSATGADTFELVPVEPYTNEDLNYNNDSSRVVYEHDNPEARVVELVESTVSDWESYDTVFIGFPTWWYDMPQALYSFFDEYDFSGKTIVPFNVHNGSRFSGTIDTIKKLEPDATVIEDGFTVSERNVAEVEENVAEWLNRLGY